jgi:hypothetical protein
MPVAADKVHNMELASIGSEDLNMSNGKRVERLLRSVEKKRDADTQQRPQRFNPLIRASAESPS